MTTPTFTDDLVLRSNRSVTARDVTLARSPTNDSPTLLKVSLTLIGIGRRTVTDGPYVISSPTWSGPCGQLLRCGS